MRKFTTITDEERATIASQAPFVGWTLGFFIVVYIALMFAFSHASPAFISSLQSYLLNPPDFSKCAPLFSARVTAHIVFAHFAILFCIFLLMVSTLARWQNGQLDGYKLKIVAISGAFLIFVALPVLSTDFLRYSRRNRHIEYHFSDFCEWSWNPINTQYLVLMCLGAFFLLVAILFSAVEFVYSGNKQWMDSLDADPEIRAKQVENLRLLGLRNE